MTERLQDLLTRTADHDPDRSAIVTTEHRVSYAELEQLTNRTARSLRDRGCTDGTRVGVLGAKTPWTIAGLIAVLRAGGIYVPIDSASPAARVGRILESAQPDVLLVDASATALVDDLVRDGLTAGVSIGSVDTPVEGRCFRTAFSRADADGFAAAPLPRTGSADDVAHLLFTSGSTGIPKGVAITHRNVLAFVDWALGYFGTKAGDRISGHPPLHFDLSTFDIYATFAVGAELHPVPSSLGVHPRGLARFIRDRELTQWFSVPSVLTYLATFDAVAQDDFPALERLLWCGEVLPTPVLTHWMRRLPHVRFTNLYGPTEATIASSAFTVERCPTSETEPVPIGTACTGEELLVLDGDLRPVPAGTTGDLHIAGIGLSPGYWRDPERTAAVFVPDPRTPGARLYRTGDLARVDDDGLVHFLGRADSQIKSRGYRIELGEIESALNAQDGVRECAAVGVDVGGFEGTTICCAFSAPDGSALSAVELRAGLAAALPSYMIPSRWMRLDALPKNVNGKIDRKIVREQFAADLAREGTG